MSSKDGKSYALMSRSIVQAAARKCIAAIEKDRVTALRILLDQEIASAKRGIFGFFSQTIDDAEAEKRLREGGIESALKLQNALSMYDRQYTTATALLQLSRFCDGDTIYVTAEDFARISAYCPT